MPQLDCLSKPTAKHAFYLSVVGCILEGATTGMAIFGYFKLGSALLLLYGLQNLVDFVSTVVVLWRFFAPGKLTPEREQVLKAREDRASVAISFLIVLMGCLVIPAAVGDLNSGAPTQNQVNVGLEAVMSLSFLSFVVFVVMTALKLHYAKILDSESLRKDGLCSIIGLFLAVLIFGSSWFISVYPDFWKIDAYCAIASGILAIFIGAHGVKHAIFEKGLNIFSLGFWKGDTEYTSSDDEAKPIKLSEKV